MTDITAFPDIQKVSDSGDAFKTFIAGETILPGQVVGGAATGVSETVMVMNDTADENAVGVAIHGATVGQRVNVALIGCVVYVANADDTTAIDAFGYVMQNDNAVGGTVSEFSPRADLASVTIDATNDTTVDGSARIIGQAIEDIAGGGTGRIIIQPMLTLYSDHTVVS
jgi:hypothetical protein